MRVGPFANVKAYEGVVQAKLGVFKAFERMAHATHPPFVSIPWCSFAATQNGADHSSGERLAMKAGISG